MNIRQIKNQNSLSELSLIGFYFLIWGSFFAIVHNVFTFNKSRKTDLDIKTRVVAIVHGLLSFILSSIFIFHFGFDLDMENTALTTNFVTLSLGYFIYDLVACVWSDLCDSKLVIHHMLVFTGFLYPLLTGRGIFGGIVGLALAESSNFCMNLRMILKMYGLRHTLLFEALDLVYLFTYIIARGGLGSVVVFLTVTHKNTPLLIKLVCLGIFVQSLTFISIMLKILRKKVKEKAERESKEIELFWFSFNPMLTKLDYMNKKSEANIF